MEQKLVVELKRVAASTVARALRPLVAQVLKLSDAEIDTLPIDERDPIKALRKACGQKLQWYE